MRHLPGIDGNIDVVGGSIMPNRGPPMKKALSRLPMEMRDKRRREVKQIGSDRFKLMTAGYELTAAPTKNGTAACRASIAWGRLRRIMAYDSSAQLSITAMISWKATDALAANTKIVYEA